MRLEASQVSDYLANSGIVCQYRAESAVSGGVEMTPAEIVKRGALNILCSGEGFVDQETQNGKNIDYLYLTDLDDVTVTFSGEHRNLLTAGECIGLGLRKFNESIVESLSPDHQIDRESYKTLIDTSISGMYRELTRNISDASPIQMTTGALNASMLMLSNYSIWERSLYQDHRKTPSNVKDERRHTAKFAYGMILEQIEGRPVMKKPDSLD
jgi:hypothetical protein